MTPIFKNPHNLLKKEERMSSILEPKTPNKNLLINTKSTIFQTPKWPSYSSRRAPSLSCSPYISSNSSSSSFRSFFHEEVDSPLPIPPQRIPFSWESIPGIPKHQIIKRLDSSSRKSNYLPLPPAAAPVSRKTKSTYKKHHIISRKDPFFAAFVECSKDDDNDDHKDLFRSIWKEPAKSLSHRFGFVNLSCKNTCSVSQSMVLLPREQPRRISYGSIKKRSG